MMISQAHSMPIGRVDLQSALHKITMITEKSLSNKEYTQTAYSLDIEGAFNNILPCSIIDALTGLGIDDGSFPLIRQILLNRSVEASLGESKLCDLMTQKLGMLLAWAHKKGVELNPSKTELVMFTMKYEIGFQAFKAPRGIPNSKW